MPRPSSVSIASRTPGRTRTSPSSSRMPSQTVWSRSQITHLIEPGLREVGEDGKDSKDSKDEEARGGALMSLKLRKIESWNRELLDLGGAFDDLHHLRVSQVAGDWRIGGAAVCPLDLHRVARPLGRRDRTEVFGDHRLGERRRIAPFLKEPGPQ